MRFAVAECANIWWEVLKRIGGWPLSFDQYVLIAFSRRQSEHTDRNNWVGNHRLYSQYPKFQILPEVSRCVCIWWRIQYKQLCIVPGCMIVQSFTNNCGNRQKLSTWKSQLNDCIIRWSDTVVVRIKKSEFNGQQSSSTWDTIELFVGFCWKKTYSQPNQCWHYGYE